MVEFAGRAPRLLDRLSKRAVKSPHTAVLLGWRGVGHPSVAGCSPLSPPGVLCTDQDVFLLVWQARKNVVFLGGMQACFFAWSYQGS